MKIILLLAVVGIVVAAPSVPKIIVPSEPSTATVLDDLSKTSIRSNEIVKTIQDEQVRGFDTEQVKEEVQRIETTTAARIEQVNLEQSKIEEAPLLESSTTTPLPLPNRADLQNFVILVPLDHFNIMNQNNVASSVIPARNIPTFGSSFHASSRSDGSEIRGSIGNSRSGLMGHTQFGAQFSVPNPITRMFTNWDRVMQGRPIIPQQQRMAHAQAHFSMVPPIGMRQFLPPFLLAAQAATNAY